MPEISMYTVRAGGGGRGANQWRSHLHNSSCILIGIYLARNTESESRNLSDRFCFQFPSGTMDDANIILEH